MDTLTQYRQHIKTLLNDYASNDKIWIQQDGTEVGIANQLVDLGVPKQDIVLGFDPPNLRKYTDFAVS